VSAARYSKGERQDQQSGAKGVECAQHANAVFEVSAAMDKVSL
jgi:hypothetical protein